MHNGGVCLPQYCIENQFTISEFAKICDTLETSLNFLHQNNICHSDIRWDNVVIDKNKSVRWIDFDMSTILNSKTEKEDNNKLTQLLLRVSEEVSEDNCSQTELKFFNNKVNDLKKKGLNIAHVTRNMFTNPLTVGSIIQTVVFFS